MRRILPVILLLVSGGSITAASGQAAPAYPDGASALSETYGDWTLACNTTSAGSDAPALHCLMTQEQIEAKSGQRALIAQFRTAGDGLAGTLVLPFGLTLPRGASWSFIEGPADLGGHLDFTVCLPVGCIMPIDLDAATLAGVAASKALQLDAEAPGGQTASMVVSLSGFVAAERRLRQLPD